MVDKHQCSSDTAISTITLEFAKHRNFLKYFLRRFLSCGQDIDDVLQDTFVSAFRAESNRKITAPKAFLFRIARNAALKELERRNRYISQAIEDCEGEELLSDSEMVENQVAARIKLGLFCESALEMSQQVRTVFLMRKVYGLSQKEIAAQLGITVSTVEKHISRGLSICHAYVNDAETLNASIGGAYTTFDTECGGRRRQ